MKLTKSQKVYVAVLVTAVAAFLVDRVFLGGDGPVEQASAAGPGVGAAEAPRSVPPSGASDAPSVGARLAELQEAHPVDLQHVREAFVPSDAWNQQLRPRQPRQDPSQPSAPAGSSSRADEFVAGHRLKSILHLDDGGVALVDDKVVRIGQTVDGFKLIELTENAAVFVLHDQRARLQLANPAGQ